MSKGVSLWIIVCFGFFMLMIALGVAIPGMNLTEFGLDFTSMTPLDQSTWQFAVWIIGFGMLMWGVTNE